MGGMNSANTITMVAEEGDQGVEVIITTGAMAGAEEGVEEVRTSGIGARSLGKDIFTLEC